MALERRGWLVHAGACSWIGSAKTPALMLFELYRFLQATVGQSAAARSRQTGKPCAPLRLMAGEASTHMMLPQRCAFTPVSLTCAGLAVCAPKPPPVEPAVRRMHGAHPSERHCAAHLLSNAQLKCYHRAIRFTMGR